MQSKNTSQNTVLESGQNTIILCEGRGDYLTGLKADGEIMGGSKADAIRYTAAEATELIEALGRGFSAETSKL